MAPRLVLALIKVTEPIFLTGRWPSGRELTLDDAIWLDQLMAELYTELLKT